VSEKIIKTWPEAHEKGECKPFTKWHAPPHNGQRRREPPKNGGGTNPAVRKKVRNQKHRAAGPLPAHLIGKSTRR